MTAAERWASVLNDAAEIVAGLSEELSNTKQLLARQRAEAYRLREKAEDDRKLIEALKSDLRGAAVRSSELEMELAEAGSDTANKDAEIVELKSKLLDAEARAEFESRHRYDTDGWSFAGKVEVLQQTVSNLTARLKQYENADWPEDAEETPIDVIARQGDRIQNLEATNRRLNAQITAIWDIFSAEWRAAWEGRPA